MNYRKLIVKMAVTFIEASLAYLVKADGINKAAIAGAVGAGLSLAWNATLYPVISQWLDKPQQ